MLKTMITSLIETFGMAQVDISRRTGVPQSAISRIYRGEQAEVGYASGKAIEELYTELCEAVKHREAA